eukprot:TRINITY_DN30107_c0_g1_i1.p1 TRINITY_DN30107_c0_g1~~TRINITY_DN30107_c0_g1_i1.p1  ORF type:complete len:1003 (+),score=108.29 TRINITY_DN30107_c0_g1_i1:63-3071(+)
MLGCAAAEGMSFCDDVRDEVTEVSIRLSKGHVRETYMGVGKVRPCGGEMDPIGASGGCLYKHQSPVEQFARNHMPASPRGFSSAELGHLSRAYTSNKSGSGKWLSADGNVVSKPKSYAEAVSKGLTCDTHGLATDKAGSSCGSHRSVSIPYEKGKGIIATLVIFGALAACIVCVQLGSALADEPDCSASQHSIHRSCDLCGGGTLFLPLGGNAEKRWPAWLRITLYSIGLLWCFLGVGIVCDEFMAAIEEITGAYREVWVNAAGAKRKRVVNVWNDTIANLTLMALGSSAPEILLSIIELFSNKMFAARLGPSTVVGSAAFNLFVITAVCVSAIPAPEVRRINSIGVFYVTAAMSIVAYLWIILILQGVSPNKVDISEGIVTLCFFIVLVVLAFIADKKFCCGKRSSLEAESASGGLSELVQTHSQILSDIVMPTFSQEKNNKMSRAQIRKSMMSRVSGKLTYNEVTIGFKESNKAVLENSGSLLLKVSASRPPGKVVTLRYSTEDGVARAGTRYEFSEGEVTFQPDDLERTIEVKIIDNNTWEPSEEFYVNLSLVSCADAPSNHLSLVRAGTTLSLGIISHGSMPSSYSGGTTSTNGYSGIKLGTCRICVWVLNDDEPGTIGFEVCEVMPCDGADAVTVTVLRTNGAWGEIDVYYETVDGTAVDGVDYYHTSGCLRFEDGNVQRKITVQLAPLADRERIKSFDIRLSSKSVGVLFDASTPGGEDGASCEVLLPGSVEKVPAKSSGISMETVREWGALWAERFPEAFYCGGSAELQAESTISEWISHTFAVTWKVLFLIVPPTPICGGWLTFIVALGMIGLITAFINDLASLLGCSVGMSDEITAITIVALGTSMPDTFASRTAARQDEFADNSIGNVTGSNSVNVFLGLGITWTIGAIYWHVQGRTPEWDIHMHGERNFAELFAAEHPFGGFFIPGGDSLVFSVAIYVTGAVLCLLILTLRRNVYGGELGGPARAQIRDSLFLVMLWVCYLIVVITYTIRA